MVECEAVFVDAAISAVLSETDSKSSLNEEQRTSLKDFLMGNDVFALHRSGEEQNQTSEISPQRIYINFLSGVRLQICYVTVA